MKQQNKQVKLDAYEDISLWQLLPCGKNGKALKTLKSIVNSIQNGQAQKEGPKPLSLLIAGEAGKLTHGYAFLRALGCEYIQHIHASMLQTPNDLIEFFHQSNPDTGYILSDLNNLPMSMKKRFYQILIEGSFTLLNQYNHTKVGHPVLGPVLGTVRKLNLIPDVIREQFEYAVELETYTDEQKKLILLQRLKYSNVEIENQDLLRILLLHSRSGLDELVRLLDLSITVMLGDGRNVLTSRDIRTAKDLL